MLNTNNEYLRPEIMDVLRAFGCENEDFTHYFSASCRKFFNSIEYCGKFYDFEEEYKTEDETEFRRYAKRFCKLAFYEVLSEHRGDLPWGALTGIRPTKLAYSELEEGRDFVPLFEKLKVKRQNIGLVAEVLKTQEGVYGGGGSDLYVSLPFCPTKCEYCSFITAPIDRTRVYLESYIDCLAREIFASRSIIKNLNSVYVGGGTPFVLECDELEKIFAALNELVPESSEYTVEAGRPDVFTEEKLRLCREYGVNRICVNPQSFNDETLKLIGRKHSAKQTLEAYEEAAKYGFDINLDLIAGLAEETPSDFAYSLDKAISLNPANITVHTLCLKSGAKLKENVKRLNVAGIAEMIEISREKLFSAGYKPYYLYRQKYQAGGLENVGWCKPQKQCVYNINVMEEITDNVALGANAISKKLFEKGERIERYAAPKDIPTYISKIEKIIAEREKLFIE